MLRQVPRKYFGIVSSFFGSGPDLPIPKDIVISAQTAFSLLKNSNVKFLDIRDPATFSQNHIPGAQSGYEFYKYLAKTDEEGIEKLKTTFVNIFEELGIKGDEHIICYEDCSKSRYGASCRAYFLLKLLGHPSVSIMDGGWQVWQQNKFPVNQGLREVRKSTFKAGWNGEMLATVADVIHTVCMEERDALIMDVRDQIEWMGSTSSPFGINFVPRKGRIPGAIWMPWYEFLEMKEDGTQFFLHPDKIRSKLLAKNIQPEQRIITYCFKGTRSANTFVALKLAGYNNVQNFQGSWNEWARDDDLPIDEDKIRN